MALKFLVNPCADLSTLCPRQVCWSRAPGVLTHLPYCCFRLLQQKRKWHLASPVHGLDVAKHSRVPSHWRDTRWSTRGKNRSSAPSATTTPTSWTMSDCISFASMDAPQLTFIRWINLIHDRLLPFLNILTNKTFFGLSSYGTYCFGDSVICYGFIAPSFCVELVVWLYWLFNGIVRWNSIISIKHMLMN